MATTPSPASANGAINMPDSPGETARAWLARRR